MNLELLKKKKRDSFSFSRFKPPTVLTQLCLVHCTKCVIYYQKNVGGRTKLQQNW